jgi:hypothetical protein
MPAALKKLAAAGFPIFGGAWLLGWLLTILKVCYDKKRISLDTFQSFLANRPTGCPPLLSDATGFVQYVQECAREKLLDSGGRDAIQMALATAWEHPLLTNGNLVFISYSHKQAAIARRLADALRALGVGAILDQDELQKESCDTVVDMWIAESLMRSVTSIYLVSDDVQYSGWVFREAEWQFRVLGIKTSLVLPYVVTFGKAQDYLKYPPSRTIQGSDLLDRFDETVQRLAARIILDWLLMLRSKAEKKHFGIAYRGKPPVYEIVVPPTFTTSSDKAE